MTRQQIDKICKYAKKGMSQSIDPQHNYSHLKRVRNNALKIIKLLELESQVDTKLLEACCYLHDLGFSVYKPGLIQFLIESRRTIRLIKPYLEKENINPEEQKIIIHAVKNHSHSFPFGKLNKNKDIYTKTLQDADTIDYFNHERVETFFNTKHKSVVFLLASLFGKSIVEHGKQNIHKYLNFPEIADHFKDALNE